MISMKQEIEDWVAAAHLYDNNHFEESILAFHPIADNSKIFFNCGVIRATLGEHQEAVQLYQRATTLDPFLAIAHFQQGVSKFLMGDFEEALANFNETLGCLRGNRYIDYEQLGLKYKLFSCEVLFNRGLCYVYLQQPEIGMTDITFASKEKATKDHEVIDDAIREKAEGYTVFSIPVGVIYRPSEAKVRNVRKQDYLGKARLVRQASQDAALHRRKLSGEMWAVDDRPADQLSYGATNLYRPNLTSRSRQQSEPPNQRNIFPPTPPPENEKPGYFPSYQQRPANSGSPPRQPPPTVERPPREQSLPRQRARSSERKVIPPRLELGAAAFGRQHSKQTSPESSQRPYPQRSHSERPFDRRAFYAEAERRKEHDHKEHLFGAVDNDLAPPLQVSKTFPVEASSTMPYQPPQKSPNKLSSELSPRHAAPNGGSQLLKPSNKRRPSRTSNPNRIEEEDETSNTSSLPEVVDDGPPARSTGYSSTSRNTHKSGSSTSSNASTIKATPTQYAGPALRVKVHIGDDTRYVMLPSLQTSTLADLFTQLARKFSLNLSDLESGKVKVKARDEEGDFVTVGDSEDWGMVLGMARTSAPSAGGDVKEVVKIDIWVVA